MDREHREQLEEHIAEVMTALEEVRASGRAHETRLRSALHEQDRIDAWSIPVLTAGAVLGNFADELATLPSLCTWLGVPGVSYAAFVVAYLRLSRHAEPAA